MRPGQVGSQYNNKKIQKISRRTTIQRMNSQHTADGEKEGRGWDK